MSHFVGIASSSGTGIATARKRRFDVSYFNAFVTISFEHFQNDREIIAALPAGSFFVFGVPNFGGPEHFRKFRSEAEIRERYTDMLDIFEIRSLCITKTANGDKKRGPCKFAVLARKRTNKDHKKQRVGGVGAGNLNGVGEGVIKTTQSKPVDVHLRPAH
jgi:hypothetical protein